MPTYEEYMNAAKNADMAGDIKAARRLVELAAQAREADTDVTTDVMKSIPAGVREHAEAGVGAFGDVQSTNRGLAEGAVETLGGPDWLKKGVGYVAGNFPLPGAQTTDQIRQSTDAVMGPNYQSVTKPAKVMREASGWAADAAIGGVPGLGRRLLAGGAGGAASELAGQATEGTGLESVARIGAGMAASSVPGIVEGTVRSAMPNKYEALQKRTPSNEQLKRNAVNDYQAMRQAGMKFDTQSVYDGLQNIELRLQSDKFKRVSAPQTHGMLREMRKEIKEGNFDFGDMIAYRQRLKDIARDASGTEKGAAGRAIEELDNYRFSLTPRDFTTAGVDPQRANQMLKRADNDYRRAAISQDLDEMIQKAEATAGTNYTMAGVHTALKREVKNYANHSKFLKPEEKQAMLEFAKSNDYANMLKQLSRFKSTVSSAAGTVGPTGIATALSGADPTAIGLTAAGFGAGLYGLGAAASSAAEREARRRIQSLDLMVRSGRVTPEQRADEIRRIMTEVLGAGARGAAVSTYDQNRE